LSRPPLGTALLSSDRSRSRLVKVTVVPRSRRRLCPSKRLPRLLLLVVDAVDGDHDVVVLLVVLVRLGDGVVDLVVLDRPGHIYNCILALYHLI